MPTFAEVGLNTKKWADWRRQLLTTGSYDPNDWDTLSAYQKKWTKDTLNTLRSLSVRDDVKL